MRKRGQGSKKYTVHSIFNLSAPLYLYYIGNSSVALSIGIGNIYPGTRVPHRIVAICINKNVFITF